MFFIIVRSAWPDGPGPACMSTDRRWGLLGPTFERMIQEQKQTLGRPLQPFASLMTLKQCAEFLGIKINTLYVMKSQGRIPTVRLVIYCASTLTRLSSGQRTEKWTFG